MMDRVADLVNDLLSGRELTGDDVVRLLLLFAILATTAHLLTMIVTRWGDRNVAFKSLLCSILVHISGWLGLVIIPPVEILAAPVPEPAIERTDLRELRTEDQESIITEEKGNTPVWEQLAPDKTELARLDYRQQEMEPLKSLERNLQEVVPTEYDVPDIEQPLEASPAEAAVSEEPGQRGPREAAPSRVDVDTVLPKARAETRPNSTSRTRITIARVGVPEKELTRQAPAGGTDRITPEFNDENDPAALQAIPNNASNVPAQSRVDDSIRRRTGPIPAKTSIDTAGILENDREEHGAAGAPAPPQFSRINPRRTRRNGRSFDALQREVAARITRSISTEFDNRRLSPDPASLSDGPEVQLARPALDARPNRQRATVAPTYRLRSLANRQSTARRFGGTDESERAVEASLRWLAEHQLPDGRWDASAHGSGQATEVEPGIDNDTLINERKRAGLRADTGITALAVLCFLGAGYTPEEGKYADSVDKALMWLVTVQGEDGNLFGDANHFARMYCHAMASYAIAEAYAMQSDPATDTRLRKPLLKAIAFINRQQIPGDGGWRYRRDSKFGGDMSMFGWQLMALKSAELAGIRIPSDVRTGMMKFLSDSGRGRQGGLAAYQLEDKVTPTMTAEALFCRQMLGFPRQSPLSSEAIGYLLRQIPRRTELNLYYWYYGTLAMYQFGGDAWDRWNQSVRDLLVSEQRQTGKLAGSWDPRGPWGPHGGRLYATALSTLTLEVYYRFLPLYRMGESEG